jgi:hypothetical protein
MGFQFADTFSTVDAIVQSPWTASLGTITYSHSYARFTPPAGCQGAGVLVSTGGGFVRNLNGNINTAIGFMSFGANGFPPATSNSGVIGFLDNGTIQCYLGWTPTGALQFYRGGSGGQAVGSPSANGLIGMSTLPTHGIEVAITFSSTVGQVQCWLDGTQVINSSASLNTSQSGHSYCNQVGTGQYVGNSNQSFYTDYVRVWDSTGSYQNAPIGLDRQPVTKVPSSAGVNTNWTANGESFNYECVNQIPPTNNTIYVSANGTAVIDDYTMPVASLLSAPTMVVASSYFEKDDSATRTYTNGVLSSGSSAVGSTFTANSSYAWVQNCISLDPNTSAPWTAAGADAAHFYHEELT